MEKSAEPLNVDLLIVGRGVGGSFLATYALRAGLSVLVIDDAQPSSASRVAAGLINPVTGKRYVETWMASRLLPFAVSAYGPLIRETSTVHFFPSPSARLEFLERKSPYLSASGEDWSGFFNIPFGSGVIRPCYIADLRAFLAAPLPVRNEFFEERDLVLLPAGVRYRDVSATYVIFCGVSCKWFDILPFSPSKGEALILEIPELAHGLVFKSGLSLVPLPGGLFWAGSSYEWNFTDALPTVAFRERSVRALTDWLRVPFKVVDHVAAVRPTTVEQKPFVGLHPRFPAIGILGGLGTKGSSLAPYFAHELVEHLVHGSPITGGADVGRFRRLLGG